jgi:hypothetical protein
MLPARWQPNASSSGRQATLEPGTVGRTSGWVADRLLRLCRHREITA